MRHSTAATFAIVAGAAIGLAALAGCQQRMTDQPKLEPYEEASGYGWQSANRPAVDGTLPWQPETPGDSGGGSVDVTLALLERGRERYDVFCSPCHGWTGEGNGMVVERGFPRPPSFHTARLRRVPPSFFYTVIDRGVGRMPSYGTRVPPADRWAIAAYIRALQLSQHAPAGMLPDSFKDGAAESR